MDFIETGILNCFDLCDVWRLCLRMSLLAQLLSFKIPQIRRGYTYMTHKHVIASLTAYKDEGVHDITDTIDINSSNTANRYYIKHYNNWTSQCVLTIFVYSTVVMVRHSFLLTLLGWSVQCLHLCNTTASWTHSVISFSFSTTNKVLDNKAWTVISFSDVMMSSRSLKNVHSINLIVWVCFEKHLGPFTI